jgi:hypothetical protein
MTIDRTIKISDLLTSLTILVSVIALRLPRCIGEIFGGRLQLSVYEGVADT